MPDDDEKIALFDFCGTMINFQSADAFVVFVKEHVKNNARMKFIEVMRKIFVKSQFMRVLQKFSREGYVNKKMLLTQLRGLPRETLEKLAEKFYTEKICLNYIPEVISVLKKHKADGFRILIVSGGYDIYLKHVAKEFGFEKVFSTEFDFKDGIFTGKYKGDDCMNQNKVKFLRKYFGVENLKGCNSVAYSDSRSDVPMMKFCRRGVAVVQKHCPPPPT